MSAPTFSTKRLEHHGIVAGMCSHIGLEEVIDEHLGGSGRDISFGVAVKAMIINALGFSSRATYLTPEFFEGKPVELLLGEGVSAEQLNDDCLGRTLDACFDFGVTELFSEIAGEALRRMSVTVDVAHLDTTSFSFHGEYNQYSEDERLVNITHGYSKDHRPDLKQAVCAVITAEKSSIPLWMEALDGNASDTTAMPNTIESFCAQLEGEDRPLMVMDSAFYSAENINQNSGVPWLSRVPDTLSEVQTLYAEADFRTWVQTDDPDYRFSEHTSFYADQQQRWLIVHSAPRQDTNRRPPMARFAGPKIRPPRS